MAKKREGYKSGEGKYNLPVKLNEGPKLQDAEKGVEIKRVWVDDPDGVISENGRSNK